MHPWVARRWYDLSFHTCTWLMGAGASLRTQGRHLYPAEGPVLVLANHQSYLDPVIIGLASSRYLSYLARESLFKNKIFAGLIKSLDAIPINHRGWSREGLQGVLDALGRNKAVLIFPEGERTYDGKLAPFKPGVALLAARSKAPIVPVGISGAYEAWPRTEKSPILNPMWCPASPRALAVSVGEPIPYSRYENMSREEMLRDLEREVQRQMDRAEALKRHAPRADAS